MQTRPVSNWVKAATIAAVWPCFFRPLIGGIGFENPPQKTRRENRVRAVARRVATGLPGDQRREGTRFQGFPRLNPHETKNPGRWRAVGELIA